MFVVNEYENIKWVQSIRLKMQPAKLVCHDAFLWQSFDTDSIILRKITWPNSYIFFIICSKLFLGGFFGRLWKELLHFVLTSFERMLPFFGFLLLKNGLPILSSLSTPFLIPIMFFSRSYFSILFLLFFGHKLFNSIAFCCTKTLCFSIVSC